MREKSSVLKKSVFFIASAPQVIVALALSASYCFIIKEIIPASKGAFQTFCGELAVQLLSLPPKLRTTGPSTLIGHSPGQKRRWRLAGGVLSGYFNDEPILSKWRAL